jgi:hypothetical protein
MRYRKLFRSGCSQRGQALLAALIILMIITVVGLSFAALYTGRVRQNTSYVHGYTAQYIAEAGINQFLWVLNSTEGWGNFDQYDFLSQTGPYKYSGYYPDGQGYYYLTAQNKNTGGFSTPAAINVTCTGWLKSDPSHPYTFQAELAVQEFTQNVYFTDHEQTSPDAGSQRVVFGSNDIINGPIFTNDVFSINGQPQFNSTVSEGLKYAPYSPTFPQGGSNFNYQNGQNRTYPGNYYLVSGTPPFGTGWPPIQHGTLNIPPAGNLAQYAQNGGYYFKGRTCIYLHVLNGQGVMDVVTYDNDPASYYPNDAGHIGEFHVIRNLKLPDNGVIYVDGNTDSNCDGPSGSLNPIKGEESSTSIEYQDTSGWDNFYNVSGTLNNGTFTDQYDNGTNHGRDLKFTNDMGNVFVSGTLSGQLTIGAANNIYICGSDPTRPYPSLNSTPPYPHLSSGGVTYNNSATDMLGLVAGNYVMLMRYDWPETPPDGTSEPSYYDDQYYPFSWQYLSSASGFTAPYDTSNPNYYDNINDCYIASSSASPASIVDDLPNIVTIDGAIMASNYSLTLEGVGIFNQSGGNELLGTITLDGSLIQEYRGAVEYIGYLGYGKNYVYDSRFLNETPPHFLQSQSSGWGVLNWRRIPTPPGIPAMSTPVLGQITGTGTNGLTVTHGYGVSLNLTVPVTPSGACQTIQWSVVNPNGTSPEIDPYTGYLFNITTEGSFTVKATSADTSVPVSTTGIVTVN